MNSVALHYKLFFIVTDECFKGEGKSSPSHYLQSTCAQNTHLQLLPGTYLALP